MKLDEALIRAAFAVEDWPAVVAAIAEHFGLRDCNDAVIYTRQREVYVREVHLHLGQYRYIWEDGRGFGYRLAGFAQDDPVADIFIP